MTQALAVDDIKHLLLTMISTTKLVDADHMAAMNEADWQSLCKAATQHRLEPILHHHCQQRGSEWVVPQNVRAHWASAYRQSALRSLSVSLSLARLDSLLNKASIPYAALKGAWLSQHAYAHPALRPMRDIDIVVPVEMAVLAFNMLIEAGYSRKPGDIMPLDHALLHHKHLPPLWCPISKTSIEVHSRLIGDIPGSCDGAGTIIDTAALLTRRIAEDSGGRPISYPSPTDTLLHLIVHSAHEHRFNNGPLVMNDIAVILMKDEIEWDRFWLMAKAGGWTRGCHLLFAMTKTYHSHIDAGMAPSGGDDVSPALISAAACLTLVDSDEFQAVSFRKELLGKRWSLHTVKYIWSRAIPNRFVLAAFAGLPLKSKRVWMQYPVWLVKRCRQIIFRKQGGDLTRDAQRAAKIDQWLKD
jgi:Uncharacterised nucleotidyltransferase